MKAWLQILIFGHAHKWRVIKEGPITDENNDRVVTYYNLQCEICGCVKVRNLR